MKKIPLTQNQVALIDDEDFDRVSQYKWCVDNKGNTSYAVRGFDLNGKNFILKMHIYIMGWQGGKIQIDHKDLNGLNNQKSNLRICEQFENGRNSPMKKNNKCGYKGVYFSKQKQKWTAEIKAHGAPKNLGTFNDPINAALAYDWAAEKHHGSFARINFPQYNAENRPKVVHSKPKLDKPIGINYYKKLNIYKASICKNNKQIHIGSFKNITDAIKARNKKSIELFGTKAKLIQTNE